MRGQARGPASADAAQPVKVGAASPPPNERIESLAMTGKRGALWWVTASWAVLSAACCAYRFFWSTFPFTSVDEPPGSWSIVFVGEIALAIAVVLTLGSIPLLITGLVGFRRAWRSAVVGQPRGRRAWGALDLVPVCFRYSLGFAGLWARR